jgi:hypothetical protein
MKFTSTLIALAAVCSALQAQDSKVPTGSLWSNKSVVEHKEKPKLSWNIQHPLGELDEVIEVDKNENVILQKDARVEVYMVGTGVTSNGGETQHTTVTHMSFGNGWEHLFTGKGDDVVPGKVLMSKDLSAGDVISFTAYFRDWRDNSSDHVTILTDGDKPPTGLGQNGGVALETYLEGYVENGKLDLGPLDIIYCAELTHTNSKDSGYDLQDSIVLVRFIEL